MAFYIIYHDNCYIYGENKWSKEKHIPIERFFLFIGYGDIMNWWNNNCILLPTNTNKVNKFDRYFHWRSKGKVVIKIKFSNKNMFYSENNLTFFI